MILGILNFIQKIEIISLLIYFNDKRDLNFQSESIIIYS